MHLPTLTRRLFLGGTLSTAGAALLAPGRARAQDAVALQLSWLHSVQFGGSYIALDRGWWQESGLEVDLLQGGQGVFGIAVSGAMRELTGAIADFPGERADGGESISTPEDELASRRKHRDRKIG